MCERPTWKLTLIQPPLPTFVSGKLHSFYPPFLPIHMPRVHPRCVSARGRTGAWADSSLISSIVLWPNLSISHPLSYCSNLSHGLLLSECYSKLWCMHWMPLLSVCPKACCPPIESSTPCPVPTVAFAQYWLIVCLVHDCILRVNYYLNIGPRRP